MDEDDWFFVAVGAAVVLLVSVLIWYHYRYPCIQYQAHWVEAWTEMRVESHTVGKSHFTTVRPIYHPAHWEQQCFARGDRHLGDVAAPYAPTPYAGPGAPILGPRSAPPAVEKW